MDSLLHDLLAPSSGFTALAYAVAFWAIRKTAKTMGEAIDKLAALDGRVTRLELQAGVAREDLHSTFIRK